MIYVSVPRVAGWLFRLFPYLPTQFLVASDQVRCCTGGPEIIRDDSHAVRHCILWFEHQVIDLIMSRVAGGN